MTPTWKPHVTVACVVRDAGRYLLVEERVGGRLVINQPAGHLEPGESLLAAARRETLEEACHEVELEALLGIYHWVSPRGKSILRFAFSARTLRHLPEHPRDPAISRTLWLRRDELEAPGRALRSPLVLRNIRDFEAGRAYPLGLIDDLRGELTGASSP